MSEQHKKILELFGMSFANEFTLKEWAELLEIWTLRIGPDGLEAIYTRWCQRNGFAPEDLDERLTRVREYAAQVEKTWKT